LNINTKERTLIFDESGNLGKQGRFFVIACIDTCNPKELHNAMKKQLRKAKNEFPELAFDGYELKAYKATPLIKRQIIKTICRKALTIHFIAADLEHIEAGLLKRKNIFYNYLVRLLLDKVIKKDFKGQKLNIWMDNHSTKVGSVNSLEDYINIRLNIERELNLDIKVEYIESDARNALVIQAADYIANSIYSNVEYKKNSFYKMFKGKIGEGKLFPWNKFAQ